MKNLKNMISAASLMAVMVVGTVSANAGLLISDRTAPSLQGQCATVKDSNTQNLDGIIIIGFQSVLDGIIIIGRAGLMISDKVAPGCDKGKSGLLISDRSGLLISD